MLIANRKLKLRRGSGDAEMEVRLYLPEREENGMWLCRYEVDWPHGTWKHAAQGVDSIQSIMLAFQMIGSELYASEYHQLGALMFEARGRGYGFPVPSSLRDLLIGDDAKYL
jgi:hypothetical protein